MIADNNGKNTCLFDSLIDIYVGDKNFFQYDMSILYSAVAVLYLNFTHKTLLKWF